MNGRIPPQNIESEKIILGSCMLSKDALAVAMEILTGDDFYHHENKKIFNVIEKLNSEGKLVDLVTVADNWNGDAAYLAMMTDCIPTSVLDHCEIVKDKALRRSLITRTSAILDGCYGSVPSSELMDMINDVALSAPSGISAEPVHISVPAMQAITEIQKQAENKDPVFGISTGLADLDVRTGGLQKGEYVLVAARPGMGKTSLALKFAEEAAKEGEGVIFFSLEMKSVRLVKRMLSASSRVPGSKMRTGYVTGADLDRLSICASLLSAQNIFIDETAGLSIDNLMIRAKKIALKNDIGLIIVDYVQLARGRHENRALEIGQISAGLLALAKELNVSVVALSQLNRNVEIRADKRPMMADLKESGALEQDADVILMIYRDEIYRDNSPDEGTAEIIIAKGRDIGTWTVRTGFNGERTEFFNLATRPQ